MTDYTKLVKALRCCSKDKCGQCEYEWNRICINSMCADAADAIEALQACCEQLKTENTMLYNTITADKGVMLERIKFLEQQMPKRGKIVRCGECVHCYAEGFAHERNICEKHPELGNVPDDWFCADGEREVQE